MKSLWTLVFVLLVVYNTVNSEIASQAKILSVQNEEDLDTILQGVNMIHMTGTPGFLSVYGPEAFPILAGQAAENVHHPVMAGNRVGQGKLIGATHDMFITYYNNTESEATSDGNTLILNSIIWVSPDDVSSPKVAILQNNIENIDPLVQFLADNDIVATMVPLQQVNSSSDLSNDYDVVITKEFFDESRVPILQEYVENGGGLIIGLTSWAYYAFLNVSGHFGENFPPNMVSRLGGFVWRSDGYSDPTAPDNYYNASQVNLQHTHVLDAWLVIRNFLMSGNFNGDLEENPIQFSSILESGFEFIPPQDSFLTEEFHEDAKNFTRGEGQPIPTEENPVVNMTDKFQLQLYYALSSFVLKPEDVQMHPGSKYFPGQVNMTDENVILQSQGLNIEIKYKKPSWYFNEQRIGNNGKSIKPDIFIPNAINTCHQNDHPIPNQHKADVEDLIFNTKLPSWFSTGLYAPPASPVTIIVNSTDILQGYEIQIGTHTDDISRHAEWFRSPRITIKKALENNQATLASPSGGLIFLIIPDNAVTEEEQILTATVTGSVRTPYFKLGQTSVKEWRDKIRYEPGAWAEFETDNIVLSAPSASARLVDDPEDLLLFWDQVMDGIADLASIPRLRYKQERITPDILISAGFMHSGYPIMTFLNEGDLAINVTKLRTEGSWGHWHELGHNHQKSEWTFSGTGEVTCNLFALYVYNTVCGIPSEETRPDMTPAVYRKTVTEFIENGRKFSDWQSQPFLALLFYHQLQIEYGWTAFKEVFGKYHELESSPSTDEEKIDLWLVMFSKVVGENLASFFDSWNIPISVNATIEIINLPEAKIQLTDLLHD